MVAEKKWIILEEKPTRTVIIINAKAFRDLGFGFVVVRYEIKGNL